MMKSIMFKLVNVKQKIISEELKSLMLAMYSEILQLNLILLKTQKQEQQTNKKSINNNNSVLKNT